MKKVVPAWMSITMTVLTFVALILMIVQVFNLSDNILRLLGAVAYIVAAVFAYIYTISGYVKKAVWPFRFFCIASAVFKLLTVICYPEVGSVCFWMDVVSLCVYLIFAVAMNLGKKKSYVLAGINVLLTAYIFVRVLMIGAPWSIAVAAILLSLMLIIMIYAKYVDKENRGRTV